MAFVKINFVDPLTLGLPMVTPYSEALFTPPQASYDLFLRKVFYGMQRPEIALSPISLPHTHPGIVL